MNHKCRAGEWLVSYKELRKYRNSPAVDPKNTLQKDTGTQFKYLQKLKQSFGLLSRNL